MSPTEQNELLIASITPQNLERGALWFTENAEKIKQAKRRNIWWQNNVITVERDLAIKPSELARKILDLGYGRTQTVTMPGLFALRGGIIEIWPINMEEVCIIEFSGNTIATIVSREKLYPKDAPKIRPSCNIETLISGSFVVHEDHGIGIFGGIFKNGVVEKRAFFANEVGIENRDNTQNLFFLVEYAPPSPGRATDKLYVPISKKERLTPYIGFETPKIHRLGGTVWFTTKRKAREDVEKLAKSLLQLYAKREQEKRAPHFGDATIEQKLCEEFSFVETEDQSNAEKEIMRDLESAHPMDRVLCGDVGFGKTEVALRALMRVMASGKQAVIMAPTTILVAQHYATIKERMKNIPVQIAMLSRLTPKKEIIWALENIKNGKIDCVVGTHRLLSRDVIFHKLGLIVIDEEQRFGVKQKERIKEFRTDVDVLSLSATPIPRTLSFTLAGFRNISHLDTPPQNRKPIATFVLPYSKTIIFRAIEEEIKRSGQIYFLHNRIETLGIMKEKIMRLFSKTGTKNNLPKIGIIHGRMDEKEVIHVMSQFRKHALDILLATTIIENGLDISRANTLIVDNATRLGLAQAHQLRGRIGRGDVQAYAYFLYPARALKKPSKKDIQLTHKEVANGRALERLEVLQEYANLGAGYEIALRDLEIRGAGNILGREQSGTVNKVGLNLYYQMLAEAIEKLK